jgi:hypothetical protein
MLTDWVNSVHGGIDVAGVKHTLKISYGLYRLTTTTVPHSLTFRSHVPANDKSDKSTAVKITEYMIDELGVDFMLGPYSSGITALASAVTENRKMVITLLLERWHTDPPPSSAEGDGSRRSILDVSFQRQEVCVPPQPAPRALTLPPPFPLPHLARQVSLRDAHDRYHVHGTRS